MDTTLIAANEAIATLDDRRRSERRSARAPGWISGDSTDRGGKGRAVTVNDLSMHGVGFHDTIGGYRNGAAHWLVVNNGAMRVSTRLKIVSCRANAEGGYDVGATFF